jgi:hypothetical protein
MRILLLLAASILPAAAGIKLEPAGKRLRVLIDGKLFTEYRADGHVPCLYPVVGPSGAGLTRNFPLAPAAHGEATDHPHHRSFWTTHGSVNGIDFWTLPKDPSTRIVHRGFLGTSTTSDTADGTTTDRAAFTVDLAWVSKGKTHLSEKRTYAITVRDNTRIVDITSVFVAADGDAVFGDTKEGSFALRLAPTLRIAGKVAKGHSINSEGQKDNDCWGKRADWVAYYGPDAKGQPAVVAIMDHPSNLRHPTWWHARPYGLVAANPFGRHNFEHRKNDKHLGDYTLKHGESLTFTHRFLFHRGTLESADLGKVWKEFSAKPAGPAHPR